MKIIIDAGNVLSLIMLEIGQEMTDTFFIVLSVIIWQFFKIILGSSLQA